ncbi:DNA polymerase [Loigolactobacillus backii]|uniref:DNA polymerase n=1 Tax=Loigolactobacillus backii TaxID=375175 RepID=UPI0022FD8B28|nr:DNA polymerase [Loigolactobacillus backii]MDA5386972.1 DNA polymerase [Loigolactobacillus backii]MDA5389510.1 DNA polymerase [Loigolactobacillus backii]
MRTLNLDLETYSEANLPKVGVYRYVNDPSFEILLFSYAIDGGEVTCIDLASGAVIPIEIVAAITDPGIIKVAFNAQFERVALSKFCGQTLDPEQWHDTMVTANELGLGGGLGQVAKFLGIDQQKDTRGTALINYFSKPCKPTKANGMRTRNRPSDAPDKWLIYITYNQQDVRTEMAIADKLVGFPVKKSEWQLYSMDQRINDRGVGVDQQLASGAVEIMTELNDQNIAQLKKVTGLDNPNSLVQFKGWLADQGYPFKTLGKATVQEALDKGDLSNMVAEALRLRLSLSNSSTKKYQTMIGAAGDDGRVHGLMQFYGANRTGRWAGRLVQVQNLPRNYLDPELLDFARECVKAGRPEDIDLIYDSVPDTLKQLIRTALVPAAGNKLVICDFSAIEARVISWFANETWSLEEFADNEDIYKATASRMFGIPKADIDKKIRQRGKVATLALGYQGSVGALKAMGALDMGIPEDELQGLVDAWRKASPHVVKFWHDVQRGAVDVIENGGVAHLQRGLKAFMKSGFLFIQLPSGRRLAYAKAALEDSDYGPRITYMGQGTHVGFTKLETYGGKLVENIVQATARDLLAQSMYRLEKSGYPAVFHVHDEVVAEVPDEGDYNVADMREIMCRPIKWADGLPLNAAGFATYYYRKD